MISGSLLSATQFDSHTTVARQAAGTREDQIAQARESSHRILAATTRHDQPGDLRQAAGDQRRNGVVAESDAIANSGRNGDDVLQCAAEFHADHVTVGVNAETGIAELSLDSFEASSLS